ncbi:hypothetical protein [Bradyrhizobium sp. MOS002]|uniref:hypothetical protein n=1 Tax=Bradyrhizobium sp. MOS002 TaxID=2133947 RepID=UPI0011B22FEA|nr:hypothetical protein [Bradyrhizobium sp. MOS002]
MTQIIKYRRPPFSGLGATMNGFRAKLERFECLASECELIAKRVDESHREMYLRASQHYRELANEVRALLASFEMAA